MDLGSAQVLIESAPDKPSLLQRIAGADQSRLNLAEVLATADSKTSDFGRACNLQNQDFCRKAAGNEGPCAELHHHLESSSHLKLQLQARLD